MPIYTYRHQTDANAASRAEGFPAHGDFEIMQKMSDAPLTVCPECGQTVRRVISLPSRAITNGSTSKLSDAAINRSGMTKYVNIGNGKYEKAAGPAEAPSVIDRNRLPD